LVSNFGLNASVTGAGGASHAGYRFGARAIERAMNVPQPAVFIVRTIKSSSRMKFIN
jgi:hypothetical protein